MFKKRFRIRKETTHTGIETYIPQQRRFLIWFDIYERDGYKREFSKLEHCKEYIDNLYIRFHITRVEYLEIV